MTAKEKQEYNRKNYLARRDEILARAKVRAQAEKITKPLTSNSRPTKYLDETDCSKKALWLLRALIVMMTLFLMRESYGYFVEADGHPLISCFKAIMMEGLVLLLSYLPLQRTVRSDFGQRVLLISICMFNIWAMSGSFLIAGFKHQHEVGTREKVIQGLEMEIRQKEILRDQYFGKGWIGVARQYEKTADSLREKSNRMRHDILKLGDSEALLISLVIAIVFRILILLANIWCTRRYSEIVQGVVRTSEISKKDEPRYLKLLQGWAMSWMQFPRFERPPTQKSENKDRSRIHPFPTSIPLSEISASGI